MCVSVSQTSSDRLRLIFFYDTAYHLDLYFTWMHRYLLVFGVITIPYHQWKAWKQFVRRNFLTAQACLSGVYHYTYNTLEIMSSSISRESLLKLECRGQEYTTLLSTCFESRCQGWDSWPRYKQFSCKPHAPAKPSPYSIAMNPYFMYYRLYFRFNMI